MAILNMVTKGSWWWANLLEPTDLAVSISWTTATITWADPATLRTIPPTSFSKSVLVRKVGSAPADPSDWTVVVEETVKDTYKTTWYEDTWLTKWTKYYYRVFSYSADGGISYWDSVKTIRNYTYTVVWNETSSPSQFFVRYEDDAAWLTQWSADFDEFFGYYGCRLASDWTESAKVEQSSPWVLDITQLWDLTAWDNVMIAFPVMWIKMSKSWSQVTLSITNELDKSGYQYYAHCTGSLSNPWTPKSVFYLWAYKVYNDWNNVLKSLSWKSPLTNQAMSVFCTRAKSNGSWYNIIWYYQRQFINALYMMKYCNPNSQSRIWAWRTSGSKANTWWTNSQTSATYWTSSTSQQVKLFWLEDWWGNVRDWIWWAYTNSSNTLYTQLSWYSGALSWWESTWSSLWITWYNYTMSSIVWNNKVLFWPNATIDNNYSSYYCDEVYVGGAYLPRASGSYNRWVASWAFTIQFDASATYKDADIGSRLLFL